MAGHDRSRGRRWSLRILLVCLWIVLAVGWSVLDVTERFSRVYDRLGGRMPVLALSQPETAGTRTSAMPRFPRTGVHTVLHMLLPLIGRASLRGFS